MLPNWAEMYANKISLVSTVERCGGSIGVIAGREPNGVSIDSKGNLLNSNAQIQSASTINRTTNGTLDNTTGTVTSVGTISLYEQEYYREYPCG